MITGLREGGIGGQDSCRKQIALHPRVDLLWQPGGAPLRPGLPGARQGFRRLRGHGCNAVRRRGERRSRGPASQGWSARDAAAAEQKAARLLARCEGAATPSVQIITARVRLTPGELDAAMQAAAGRSNKQIASDMQLSVRTVEKPPATRLRQTRGLRPPRAGRCAAGAANRLTGERSADPVGRGARCTAGSARRPPRSQQ